MDLQAQLALKGIKIQRFCQAADNGVMIIFEYKWVTATGEVRWDYGYTSFNRYTCENDECDSNLTYRIINKVERIRESLKGKTPEVL